VYGAKNAVQESSISGILFELDDLLIKPSKALSAFDEKFLGDICFVHATTLLWEVLRQQIYRLDRDETSNGVCVTCVTSQAGERIRDGWERTKQHAKHLDDRTVTANAEMPADDKTDSVD
jgi:hypothetical protein